MTASDSTFNIIISGLMGAIGGLVSIPLNAYIMWRLKKSEQYYQHKLDIIAKERELFLQHKLEMKRMELENTDVNKLRQSVISLEQELMNMKKRISQKDSEA